MNADKIRILQVVGGMNRGGTETWLMHILRHLDTERFQMDFLVHGRGPFDYEQEIRDLGSRLLVCERGRWPWTYSANFRHLIREQGPFDVVHAHVQHYNGVVLRLARQAGVAARIAHSHLDSSAERASAGLARRLYLGLTDRWIKTHATLGIAVSKVAGSALFGPDWEESPKHRLLYCGIDLSAFAGQPDCGALRRQLGLPADAIVVGHAGRMMEQKNHKFLVEIFAAVARQEPRAWLLLIGNGPLRGQIEEQVKRAGLRERVVFAGVRPDVPALMLGAMDLFLFPSLYEGLPLVGMEVQAAGLPIVMSDVIAAEMDLVPELVHRLPLSSAAEAWADQVIKVLQTPRAIERSAALERVAQGPFNIETGIRELMAMYQEQVELARGGCERRAVAV